MGLPVVRKQFCPRAPRLTAARANPCREVIVDAIGHEELCVLGPSVVALAESNLFIAKRFAVGSGGIVLVRRTIADMAIQDNKSGASLLLSENLDCMLDAPDVVGVADP